MIGLGSNRLSVCRRGGMSVTQAGRGGMEWLAGFRAPSWATPYSAQATAALKAQFPTQWETIRDYGFAHPEIVPYVNEDYFFVCSLGLPGMPIRLACGDGASWVETPNCITGTETIEKVIAKMLIKPETASKESGAWGASNWPTYMFGFTMYNNKMGMTERNGNVNNGASLRINQLFDVEGWISGAYSTMKLDGVEYTENSGALSVTPDTVSFCILNRQKTTNRAFFGGVAELIRQKNGVEYARFYPFKRKVNGVVTLGFLELLGDNFYTNAGTGTIYEEFGYMQNGSWVTWTPAA